MHELSLCGAIADIAARNAGERRVEAVHVRIGQLRQVVPDSLLFCWSMVIADSDLDGCALDVERIAAELRCRSCAAENPMGAALTFACPACGSIDVEVIAGDEFLVTALELAEA